MVFSALIFALAVVASSGAALSVGIHDSESKPSAATFLGSESSVPSNTSTLTWLNEDAVSNTTDVVTFRITASVPSINLESIPEFLDIACTNSTATVKFSNTSFIASWNREPMLLLVSDSYRCGQGRTQQFSMMLTKAWSVFTANKSVVFQTTDPETSGVKGDFDIESRKLTFQSASDNANAMPVSNLFRRDMSPRTRSVTIPTYINMGIRGGVIIPSKEIGVAYGIHCEPCHVYANTKFTIGVHGTLFPLNTSVSLTWSGDYRTSTNMAFDIMNNDLKAYADEPIEDIDLKGIDIPGLSILSPRYMFTFRTMQHIDLKARLGFRMNMDMNNFTFSVSTKHGITATNMIPKISASVTNSFIASMNSRFMLTHAFTFNGWLFGKRYSGGSVSLANILTVRSGRFNGEHCLIIDIENRVASRTLNKIFYMQLGDNYVIYKSCNDGYML